jgi:hypothetical protein
MPWDFPLEKLAIKWSEIIERLGVGILSPIQIKREGRAHAEVRRVEKLLEAQTVQELEDVRLGRKIIGPDLKLLPGPNSPDKLGRREPYLLASATPEDLLRITSFQQADDGVRKLINVRAAIHIAEAALNEVTDDISSKEQIHIDWLSRWKDGASDISDEQIRVLWGKVLAGEVQRPGQFSLSTLAMLRNLSRAEAERVAKIAGYVIDDSIIREMEPHFQTDGLTFGSFLELEELGILSGVQGIISTTFHFSLQQDGRYAHIFKTIGRRAIVAFRPQDKPTQDLTLRCFRVTRVGKEILSLGSFTPNEKYLHEVAKRVRDLGYEVSVGNWVDHGLGKGEFIDEITFR